MNQHQTSPSKEEEAEASLPESLQALFTVELLDQITSQKWEEKKEALNRILQILQSNSKLPSADLNDIFDFLKSKLKKFKETNLFLLKDSLSIFSLIMTRTSNKAGISSQLIEGFFDKIGEAKLTQDIQKLFQSMIDINHEAFFSQIFTKLKKEKKIPILKEFASFFEEVINLHGLMMMNKDDLIQFCINLSNNPNPQIRANAMKLFVLLYQHIGSPLRKHLSEIKDSTRKLIEDAFNKIDGDNMDKYLAKSKSEASLIESSDSSISQAIPNALQYNIKRKPALEADEYLLLFKAIDTGKWAEKKQAINQLELNLSQMASFDQKRFPIDDFIFLLKDKLRDKNQKLVLAILSLLEKTVELLKGTFKTYSDVIALPLINNLNDNKDQVRNAVILCLEKWVQYIGFESVLTYLLNALQIEKYDLRLEILRFLSKFKEKITKAIESLIAPLLICLQDKSNVIRNISEEMIRWTFDKGLNVKHYNELLSQFKPAIAEKLKCILDNCHSSNKSDKFNTIDNSNSTSSYLLGCVSDRDPMMLNTHSIQTPALNNTSSSKSLKKNLKEESSPKKAKTISSRDVSPSSSNSNEKVYQTDINFLKMKKSRNAIDQKLQLTYDSIADDNNDNGINAYLSLFFCTSFIKKSIASLSLIEVMKLFVVLPQKDSFQQCFYPNYDLTLKYIIRQLAAMKEISKDILVSIEQYLKQFLNQIILNDLPLDYIEAKLSLQLLLNGFDCRGSLIKLFIDVISIEQSFAIMLEYGLIANAIVKLNALNSYSDILSKGRMSSIDISNFKLLIKYLYLSESAIREKATQLFETVESIIGKSQWEKILKQLDSNEQSILINNLRKVEGNDAKPKAKLKETDKRNEQQSQHKPLNKKEVSQVKELNKKELIGLLTQINETESLSVKNENTTILLDFYNNTSPTAEQSSILVSSADLCIQTVLYEIEAFFNPNEVESEKAQSYLLSLLSLFETIAIHKEQVNQIAEDTLVNSFIALFNFLQMDQDPSIPKAHNALFTLMNNIALRLIENSDITLVLIILLDIAERYKEENKTGALAVNCLLNLLEHLRLFIEDIHIGAVLNKMNEILDNYTKEELKDSLTAKIIKKMLFELIKLRKSEIINDYDNSVSNNAIADKYIFDWIDKCLEHLSKPARHESGHEGSRTNKAKSSHMVAK